MKKRVTSGKKLIPVAGEMISEKRDNATMWERSTECYEFECNFERGPIFWNRCNGSDEFCEDDKCIIMKEEMTYTVEIEVEGMEVTDMNMTEIRNTISDLTQIEMDKLRIRIDANDNDKISRIIVIADDASTADIISKTINAEIIDQSQSCQRNNQSLRIMAK